MPGGTTWQVVHQAVPHVMLPPLHSHHTAADTPTLPLHLPPSRLTAASVSSVPGRGVMGHVLGHTVAVGSLQMACDLLAQLQPSSSSTDGDGQGGTSIKRVMQVRAASCLGLPLPHAWACHCFMPGPATAPCLGLPLLRA